MKVTEAEFVLSAAGPRDFPRDAAPQIALVGRSNVGKSSLVNALTKRRVARISAAPGKTRLANIYRVRLAGPSGARPVAPPTGASRTRFNGVLYLVDLPGYGYARGGAASVETFEQLTRDYFAQRIRQGSPIAGVIAALDGRHPGLAQDLAAYEWVRATGLERILVATKVDRLSRSERERNLRAFRETFEDPVLPVSAVSGEGLEELWKTIVRLASQSQQQ